jgi:UDP-2,4-diacetamido-2,4,6-trideoxy-beta-L-altropyranose hydrolase
MQVTIALRAGGGPQRGFGHIRRCLTLAEAVCTRGGRAVLILNHHDAAIGARQRNHVETAFVDNAELHGLDQTLAYVAQLRATTLLVDSYDVSRSALERVPVPLGVIVDAAPAVALPAALVTSAVPGDAAHWPVRPGTRLLLGPRYALVRRQFFTRERAIAGEVRRILVTTGGTDVDGGIVRLVEAVCRALSDAIADVIVGRYFTNQSIQALEQVAAANPGVILHRDVDDARDLMLGADLALTGGGQTTFELAATGTPAIAVGLVDNQARNLISLKTAGALVYAGEIGDADTIDTVHGLLSELSRSRERRERMSLAGRRMVDGRGAERVADELLRLARPQHAEI